jgi:sulfur-carrier protein adenylyltransferase/sulfurtransferase
MKLRKDPACRVCGEHRIITAPIDYEQFCGIRGEELEAQISRLPGSILIPLNELPQRVAELNTADQIIVHCKMGGRSSKAVEFLKSAGFRKVKNLVGGINAWAEQVDATLARY